MASTIGTALLERGVLRSVVAGSQFYGGSQRLLLAHTDVPPAPPSCRPLTRNGRRSLGVVHFERVHKLNNPLLHALPIGYVLRSMTEVEMFSLVDEAMLA